MHSLNESDIVLSVFFTCILVFQIMIFIENYKAVKASKKENIKKDSVVKDSSFYNLLSLIISSYAFSDTYPLLPYLKLLEGNEDFYFKSAKDYCIEIKNRLYLINSEYEKFIDLDIVKICKKLIEKQKIVCALCNTEDNAKQLYDILELVNRVFLNMACDGIEADKKVRSNCMCLLNEYNEVKDKDDKRQKLLKTLEENNNNIRISSVELVKR